VSLAANLVGITWGLPARWHPDEKADDAAQMVAEGTIVPRSFINPSLPLYMMMPVVAAQQRLAAWGLLPASFSDPLLAGRVLAALAAAGAVLVIGLWAAPRPTPLAAFLLALAPGFVNLGHFATPEPWLLLATAGVLAGCRLHLDNRLGAAALGLLVGLAGATKYTAAALLLPTLIAVCLGPEAARSPARPRVVALLGLMAIALGIWITGASVRWAFRLGYADGRLLPPEAALRFVSGAGAALVVTALMLLILFAGIGRRYTWATRLSSAPVGMLFVAAAGGFLLGTPGALLRPFAFLSDLAFNQQTRSEYKGLVGESTSFGAYGLLLIDALTWPLLVLAVAGLVIAVARGLKRHPLAWVWVAAAVTPYLLVASSGHRALRFLAPVFPVAALLAADATTALVTRRTRLLVTAAVVARLAAGTVLVDRLFLVDSRRMAARWLDANVPAGMAIDVITNHPGYAPAPSRHALRVVPTLSREMAPKERFEEAARAYPQAGAPWLVLTESYYQRFLEHPEQHPERAQFFRDLLDGRSGFDVAARFRQQGWLRPPVEFVDPEIVVLRRP